MSRIITCPKNRSFQDKQNKNLDAYMEKFIPRSHVYQTNKNVYCYFCASDFDIVNHKIKRQYRKCRDEASCSVRYRVDYCGKKNIGRIEVNGEHTHELEDSYDNENSICDEIKVAILLFILTLKIFTKKLFESSNG